MIDALILDYYAAEIAAIKKAAWQIAALLSDEEWNWHLYSDSKKFADFVKDRRMVDFACIDVTGANETKEAESVRAASIQAHIMLIADETISPLKYLRPSIMPGSLLLRPYSQKQLHQTLRDALKKLLDTRLSLDTDSSFQIPTKAERRMIPYSQIYYFEAREKKIFVNTGNQEFSFYDTIDHLQEALPPSFLRCHRSFVVSKAKIDKIFISKNYLELDNGMIVPLSRTYKGVLKELK